MDPISGQTNEPQADAEKWFAFFFPQKIVVFGGLNLMKYARLLTYTYDVMSNRLERGKIKQLF